MYTVYCTSIIINNIYRINNNNNDQRARGIMGNFNNKAIDYNSFSRYYVIAHFGARTRVRCGCIGVRSDTSLREQYTYC